MLLLHTPTTPATPAKSAQKPTSSPARTLISGASRPSTPNKNIFARFVNQAGNIVHQLVAPLLKRKWLIFLTTLFISLIGVFSWLLMQPANITISTVLLAGVLLGFFLGAMFAFLHEWRNNLLVGRDELEALTGYKVLGVIPNARAAEHFRARDIVYYPYSRITEAYRLIATLLLHSQEHRLQQKVKLVTSVNAGEGKSVSSANLAYCLADLGAKVLLLDADLRMPSVHNNLGVQNKPGLINYLLGTHALADVTHAVPGIPGLFVITAGSALDFSPANLLSRNIMVSLLNNAKKYFDHVIIDAPPVRGFADTLLLHALADVTLIVVPENRAALDQFSLHISPLLQVKDSIAGLLKVRASKDVVAREYYREYARAAIKGPLGSIRLKAKRKLNLGRRYQKRL